MNISSLASEQWRVKSEEWRMNVENRLRFSSSSFLSSLLSLLSSNFVRRWSVWMDSNHRPRAYQARALTTWATNRYSVFWFFPSFSARVVCLSAGGDDGIRTHDPLLAGQVLSQLSYTPIPRALFFSRIVPVPENWTTKDLYPAFCVPTSSWLVWQNRDILSRSP